MFTEDYLMRIINQVIAALMNAIGLRTAGKYTQARQVIEQAIQQLTGLDTSLVDQLDDASILSMLTTNGHLDVERLALLGDLYQEEGANSFEQGQPVQGTVAYTRALRFILEVALADDDHLSPENMIKIGSLVEKLKQAPLPIETQMALSDYYRRLLDKDDQTLAAGGASRDQVDRSLARLQDQIDSSMNKMDD
jgi:hypothetical protein